MEVNSASKVKNETEEFIDLSTFDLFKKHIDHVLCQYLPVATSPYHQQVIDALRYSFEIGGKRIRPMLLYGAYQSVAATPLNKQGPEQQLVRAFMASMEMIHTYSLIHDDLPAMDNDDLRRGMPTCHIKFGEANAILAGDGLLNFAFETVLSKVLALGSTTTHSLKALYELAKSAGVYGMIGGQAADMFFETHELTEKEQLEYIHKHKTGAIITSSLVIGGLLAGADDASLERLKAIGHAIGLSFQIQDDILDCTSTAEVLGKPIGSDVKNNKKTYVSFVGLEQSKKDVNHLLTQAKEDVYLLQRKQVKDQMKDQVVDQGNLLIELIDFLINRTY
jgi:geranylgeranyl diphosphate synthase, type II